MSASEFHSDKSHREFLPSAIGSGLRGWLRRACGAALLGLTGLGWLGLLSWELPGHDRLGAGTNVVAHLFGKLPGQSADFLLQSFGIGAAILFSIPTFWGLQLLARLPLSRPMQRVLTWPMATLAAAAAFSALPAPSNWPFARGLGGVVGDQILALFRAIVALASPGYASGISGAGFALVAAGLVAFAARSGKQPARVRQDSDPVRKSEPGFALPRRERLAISPASDDLEPEEHDEPAWHVDATLAADPDAKRDPHIRMAPARDGQAPAFVRMTVAETAPPEPRDDPAEIAPEMPMHVPYDDLPDDDESRRMAERFAPASSSGATKAAVASDGPAPAWLGWRALLERTGDAAMPATSDLPPASRPFTPQSARDPEIADLYDHPSSAEPFQRGDGDASSAAYRVPSVGLLAADDMINRHLENDSEALVASARRLEDVLRDFGVRAKIISVLPGPRVTHFEVETASSVKVSRVIGLAEDIARAVGAATARVAAIPGRGTIGIELPNELREKISLRRLLETRAYRHASHVLPLAVGMGLDRQPIISDLSLMPGLLVAGMAGSGKSTALRAMVMSLLLRLSPDELRLLLIDPKQLAFQGFDGMGHLLAPAIGDPRRAIATLSWCVAEAEERLKLMAKLNMRSIGIYNNAVRNALRQGTNFKRAVQTGFDRQTGQAIYEEELIAPKAMPYIVVVIDDLDAVLQVEGPDTDVWLQRLGQMSKAVGVHVVAATGDVESELLSAGLRATFPARLSFKLASKAQSRVAINDAGAELLIGAGDLLFSVGGAPVRGQAPILSDPDTQIVADAIRRQGPPNYEPSIGDPGAGGQVQQPMTTSAWQQGSRSIADLRSRLGQAYDSVNNWQVGAKELDSVADDQGHPHRQAVLLSRTASA